MLTEEEQISPSIPSLLQSTVTANTEQENNNNKKIDNEEIVEGEDNEEEEEEEQESSSNTKSVVDQFSTIDIHAKGSNNDKANESSITKSVDNSTSTQQKQEIIKEDEEEEEEEEIILPKRKFTVDLTLSTPILQLLTDSKVSAEFMVKTSAKIIHSDDEDQEEEYKEFEVSRSAKDFELLVQLMDAEFFNSIVIPPILTSKQLSVASHLGGISRFSNGTESSSSTSNGKNSSVGSSTSSNTIPLAQQIFMEQVLKHEILRDSICLWSFLTIHEEWVPEKFKKQQQKEKQQSSGRGVFFSVRRWQATGTLNQKEDAMYQYLKQMSFCTKYFLEHFASLVKSIVDINDSFDDVGRYFKIFANTVEKEEKKDMYDMFHNHGDLLMDVARKCDEWMLSSNDQNVNILETVVSKLVFYSSYCELLQQFLQKRSQYAAELSLLQNDAKKAAQELERLEKSNASEQKKKAATERKKSSAADFKRTNEKYKRYLAMQEKEIEHFRRQFYIDLQVCLELYAQTQMNYLEQSHDRWGELVEEK